MQRRVSPPKEKGRRVRSLCRKAAQAAPSLEGAVLQRPVSLWALSTQVSRLCAAPGWLLPAWVSRRHRGSAPWSSAARGALQHLAAPLQPGRRVLCVEPRAAEGGELHPEPSARLPSRARSLQDSGAAGQSGCPVGSWMEGGQTRCTASWN